MQIAKENKICISPFFRAALLELRNPIRTARALEFNMVPRVRIWRVYLGGIVNIIGPEGETRARAGADVSV